MKNDHKSLMILLFPLSLSLIMVFIANGQEIKVTTVQKLNLSGTDLIEVDANEAKGFNFPFFLFIPDTVDRSQAVHLLVETNNTGTTSDDFQVHYKKARNLAYKSYANRMAQRLGVPLLVPTFPRPSTQWQAYTHALDRDTLEIYGGPFKRLDLQLIAMIDYAHQLLRTNDIQMHDRIFMHGFSASAKFCNRFTFLHPTRVKAAAAGGVNGLPTLPIRERDGHTLPFPIGIADIETFTGQDYDEAVLQSVAQYVYMGYLDRNDTLPSRDAWRESEARVIKEALAERMMPDRWAITQAIYREKLSCAQCVTYNGTDHTIRDEMLDDIVKFFQANTGDSFVAIKPYVYEHRELTRVHINKIYWKGDKDLPDFVTEGLDNDNIFLLGISEWLDGQSHSQLDLFFENAGFNMILHADGQEDIVIDRRNYEGNCSAGDGNFQAFYIHLNADQYKALAPGVSYSLQPVNQSEKFVWLVNDGVKVTKPLYDEILSLLNNTFPGKVAFNDVPGSEVASLLNQLVGNISVDGTDQKIRFNLDMTHREAVGLPDIRFSAENLSIMEIMMIICHRTSLEYHIEETTIAFRKK